jgi:hypothetical protein
VASHDPYFLVQVIEQVNSPWIRTLPDFGKLLMGTTRTTRTLPSTPCLDMPTPFAT